MAKMPDTDLKRSIMNTLSKKEQRQRDQLKKNMKQTVNNNMAYTMFELQN